MSNWEEDFPGGEEFGSKLGREEGSSVQGYRGPGSSDPEGEEAGRGDIDDFDLEFGAPFKEDEWWEDEERMGDDSKPWPGHTDPPVIIQTDPTEPVEVIPPVLPPPPPDPLEGTPVGTPLGPHPNQPDPPKIRPVRTKRPAVKLKKDVVTDSTTLEVEFTFTVDLTVGPSVVVPVYSILFQAIQRAMKPNFDEYYDQSRMGKTLLNFGGNEQLQIINWKKFGPSSEKVALRLKDPLPTQHSVDDRVTVARETQNSVFDVIKFLPVDAGPLVPQLRPSVTSAQVGAKNKVTGTLTDLVTNIAGGTGSLGVSSSYSSFIGDQVLENHYNVNSPSLEINADYSNFENFVTFGSAQKRLDVFKAKLEKLETLVKQAPVFVENLNIIGTALTSGSYETIFGTLDVFRDDANAPHWAAEDTTLSQTAADATVYNLFATASGTATDNYDYVNSSMEVSKEMQELIRSFDGYEQELWFESNLPYSASDETHHDIDNKYKADYTYPTILGIPLATTFASSSNWYNEMSAIATSYDANNKNRLTENIPDYLWDDADSVDFVTFTDLIGHHFDNVKIYIKNLENLSSRYPKINKEISAPMAAHVMESFGVNLPSISSVESLVRHVSGDNTGSVSYKKIADEYYKRYVHALPFLLKTKGTKQSVNSLLNVFGINPNLLTIQESLIGKHTTIEPTTVTTSEQDFSLNFNSGSWLSVPFFTNNTWPTSERTPQTIQARLSFLDARSQTVFNFEPSASYRLDAELHPSASTNTYYANYGRFALISGSASASEGFAPLTDLTTETSGSTITSDYFDLFDENDVSIQLKVPTLSGSSGVALDIRKIENEQLTFSQSLQESATSMSLDWSGLTNVYIGPPAKSSSVGYHLSASLDEFRMWGEQINDGKFIEFAENPGMFAGNIHTSSLQELYVRLSFNIPQDVRTLGYVTNTSPYVSKSQAGLTDLATIASTASWTGGGEDGNPFNVGTSPLYQSQRKIRTAIETSYKVGANTPTTDMIRVAPDPPLSGSLSSTSTLVSVDRKFQTSSMGSSKIDLSISPIDAVDRDVIRSFGNLNLGDFIGRPIDKYADNYPLLDHVEGIFVDQLAPTIDYNSFIKFFDKFLHLFSESVKDYIPARARVTEGIVIRSPILHRNKLNTSGRSGIEVSGEVTRRTNNAITTPTDDVVRSFDAIVSSVTASLGVSDLQGDATNVDKRYEVLPNYTGRTSSSVTPHISTEHGYDQSGYNSMNGTAVRTKEQGIKSVVEAQLIGFTEDFHNTTVGSSVVTYPTSFPGPSMVTAGMSVSGTGIPLGSVVTDVTDHATLVASGLYRNGLGSFTISSGSSATQTNVTLQFSGDVASMPTVGGSTIGDVTVPSLIEPTDDFKSPVTTANSYISHPDGLTYIDGVRLIPVTQSWMPPTPNVYEGPGGHQTGSWVRGNSYVLGDVVLQPDGTKDSKTLLFKDTGSAVYNNTTTITLLAGSPHTHHAEKPDISTNVIHSGSFIRPSVGQIVTGNGIPDGTTITSIISPTDGTPSISFTISQTTTGGAKTKEPLKFFAPGDELLGNGKYFVFTNQGFPENSSVVSDTAPELDAVNWTPLKYMAQSYQRLARLAHLNGNTENISVMKDIIVPGLKVTGDQIAYGWSPNKHLATSFTDATCLTDHDGTATQNKTVTHTANNNIVAGLLVTGLGIPNGTSIVSITNTTSFLMSAAATATNTTTLTFTAPNVTVDSVTDYEELELISTHSFTEVCNYDDDPTITHDANTNIVVGMSVTGLGIPAGATVASLNGSSNISFELSTSTTGGAVIDGTLTFISTGYATGTAVSGAGTTASGSLTFTDGENNSFTHLCSTTVDPTVTHIPRYDSIPLGYTRKHIKFHRDDSLGARRRTYLGTLNTETTSLDFAPPFEAFDSDVNTITVGTQTSTNTINTGTQGFGTNKQI